MTSHGSQKGSYKRGEGGPVTFPNFTRRTFYQMYGRRDEMVQLNIQKELTKQKPVGTRTMSWIQFQIPNRIEDNLNADWSRSFVANSYAEEIWMEQVFFS